MPRRIHSFIFASLIWLLPNVYAESLDIAALTNIAAHYNLPMPPKEASLVLAHTGSYEAINNPTTSREPGIYSPAFLLEEERDGSIVILRGTRRETINPLLNEPLWRPFSILPVKPTLGGYAVDFGRLSAFVCAVQLMQRGQESTALEIWQHFKAAQWWADGQSFNNVAEQVKNPSLLLGDCLFDYLRNQILQQPTNWADIHVQMAALFEGFPALKNDERIKVFKGLTAAVTAKPPPPNSIEALLLDWSRRPVNIPQNEVFQIETESEADVPAREIILRGANAVPDLIALLDDERITTHEAPAFMNAPARIQSLGELAKTLLTEITGIQPAALGAGKSDVVVFQKWLEKCHDKGEAEALAESVFVRSADEITGINAAPAWILAQKFPNQLAPLCNLFLKAATVDTQSFPLAKAIASAQLPKKDRVKILSEFAKSGSLEHKRCVLQVLAKLDAKACIPLLEPLLDEMPGDSSGPYWMCPEAAFTHVVMQIEDDKVWCKYLKTAKRSSVGLRMEMMEPFDYTYIGGKNRERRLAFAANFLDDTALRDMASNKAKFEGPCAAFNISQITVQNFAAMQIATILGIQERPDEFWTSAQWETLRKSIHIRLAVEKLPKLD